MKKVGEQESREAMEARVSAQVEAIDVDCSREVDMVVLHCSATPEAMARVTYMKSRRNMVIFYDSER